MRMPVLGTRLSFSWFAQLENSYNRHDPGPDPPHPEPLRRPLPDFWDGCSTNQNRGGAVGFSSRERGGD